MLKKICSYAAAVFITIFILPTGVWAQTDYSRYMYSFTDDSFMNIISELTENVTPEKCCIGEQSADITEFGQMSGESEVNTVILIDSYVLLGSSESKINAQHVLEKIISDSCTSEQYSLLSFSDGMLDIVADQCDQQQISELAINYQYSANFAADVCDSIKMASDFADKLKDADLNRIVYFTDSAAVSQLEKCSENIQFDYPVYIIDLDKTGSEEINVNSSSYIKIINYSEIADNSFNISDFSHTYITKVRLPQNLSKGENKISMLFSSCDKKIIIEKSVNFKPDILAAENNNTNKLIVPAVLTFLIFFIIIIMTAVFRKRMHIKKETVSIKSDAANTMSKPDELAGINTVSVRKENQPNVILSSKEHEDYVLDFCEKKEYIIGRSRSLCDVYIQNDKSISNQHCKISVHNSEVFVTDLGSLNKTYVDDTAVRTHIKLANNSILKIGRIYFSVRIQYK